MRKSCYYVYTCDEIVRIEKLLSKLEEYPFDTKCNMRALHKFLQIKYYFANWMKERIFNKYKLTEGVDYIVKRTKLNKVGNSFVDYDMNIGIPIALLKDIIKKHQNRQKIDKISKLKIKLNYNG